MDYALTIAGSDSSAGAGVQADLKTFFKLKVPAVSVITAITAQNSKGVYSIHPIPPEEIENQLKTLENDFNIKAAKVGMLPNIKSVEVISIFFKRRRDIFFLLDPVLVSTSGFNLFVEDTKSAIKEKLIPLCNLITPNLDEAKTLLEAENDNILEIAKSFFEKFKVPVLLKGGHLKSNFIEDIYFDGKIIKKFRWKREKGEFHGTGCILSSAIASYIVLGFKDLDAIKKGREFLHRLLKGKPYLKNKNLKYII